MINSEDDDSSRIFRIFLISITTMLIWTFPILAKETQKIQHSDVTWDLGYLKPIPTIITEKTPKLHEVRYFGNGECVPYVRQRTGIQLFGSAHTIFERAHENGYSTTSKPIIGSIVVTTEGKIGHVAVVEEMNDNIITISEQNYKGPYIVSTRTIDINNNHIKGYIYE